MRKVLVVGIIVLFILVGIYPSLAIDAIEQSNILSESGNILYVGGSGPGNYTKIQDAIDDASDGDTIFVYDDSSPYYEHIVLNKSINLIGEDRDTTIIDGRESGIILKISAKDAMISNFTILNGKWGIVITKSPNVLLNENAVYQAQVGVVIDGSELTLCKNNNISRNIIGIILNHTQENTIEDNVISNNREGIHLEYSNRNTVQKNNFIDNDKDVIFGNSFLNRWRLNYWNQSRILPKPIFGFVTIPLIGDIPWINIDWRPAKEKYDIRV